MRPAQGRNRREHRWEYQRNFRLRRQVGPSRAESGINALCEKGFRGRLSYRPPSRCEFEGSLHAPAPRPVGHVAAPHGDRGRARSCSAPPGRRPRPRWPARCCSTAPAPLFVVLAVALVVAVLSDLAVGPDRRPADRRLVGRRAAPAVPGRLRPGPADAGDDAGRRAARPHRRRRLPGRPPSCAAAACGSPSRSPSALLSIVTALVVWWPAGVGMLVLGGAARACALREPTQRIAPARMAEEEAWSDLAAVMEESIHGQDDVRTSLARPYVLRLYAQRASEVLARGRRVWTMSARVTAIAAGVIRAGIAAVVVGGAWALATGRIDGARLTAIWLLALAFGAHRRARQPDGAGAAERARRLGPGAAAARRRRRSRPAGAAPVDGDLAVRDLTFRYAEPDDGPAAGPARRQPDLRARPLVRADRPDRLRQVDPGQGAHPGGRRAARHGLPRRHRPASTSTSRGCAGGSRSCRSAPRSWPARWPRTSRCSTRTCSTAAGAGAGRARPDVVGGRPARRHATPGSATAATCCRPGRSSWSRSPASWSATRTW